MPDKPQHVRTSTKLFGFLNVVGFLDIFNILNFLDNIEFPEFPELQECLERLVFLDT